MKPNMYDDKLKGISRCICGWVGKREECGSVMLDDETRCQMCKQSDSPGDCDLGVCIIGTYLICPRCLRVITPAMEDRGV